MISICLIVSRTYGTLITKIIGTSNDVTLFCSCKGDRIGQTPDSSWSAEILRGLTCFLCWRGGQTHTYPSAPKYATVRYHRLSLRQYQYGYQYRHNMLSRFFRSMGTGSQLYEQHVRVHKVDRYTIFSCDAVLGRSKSLSELKSRKMFKRSVPEYRPKGEGSSRKRMPSERDPP